MVRDTSSSSSNAEQQVNTHLCHPCMCAGLSFTANSDKWAQHGQINAGLAHEQPLLKAPDTILDSSMYLTITSQQTIGTATGNSSLASSLLCSGFFMNTTGVSGGSQQPQLSSRPCWEGQCNLCAAEGEVAALICLPKGKVGMSISLSPGLALCPKTLGFAYTLY